MTFTYSTTFTRTHAKHLASKVIADLYLCSVQYDRPSSDSISAYEGELVTLLAGGYVDTYEFGFKNEGRRVLSWQYTVGPAGDLDGDSRSGRLVRGVDVQGAKYFNYLDYSQAWWDLTSAQREEIKVSLPVQRTSGNAPGDGDGHWADELGYTAGGVLVRRRVFRPW